MLKYLCMNILQHENELKQYMFCSLAINSEEDIRCLIRLLEYSKIWNVAVSYMSGFLFLSWKQKIMVFSKVCSPRSLREDWEKQNQQIHQANKRQEIEKPLDGFSGLIQSFLILGRFPVLHSVRQICLLSYEKFISLSSCFYFVSDQHFAATLGRQLSVNHVPLSYICILPCSCLILYCVSPCHGIFAYNWKS